MIATITSLKYNLWFLVTMNWQICLQYQLE